MGIEVKGLERVIAILNGKIDGLEPKFRNVMESETTAMKVRIGDGKDVDGRSFEETKPYTKAYAKKKGKTTVDHYLKGDMMGGIHSTVVREGDKLVGRVTANTDFQRNKIRWNSAIRNFFGFAEAQFERIRRKMNE